MQKDGFGRLLQLHVAVLSTAGAVAAAAVLRRWHGRRTGKESRLPAPAMAVMPRLERTDSGGIHEKFSHYVGSLGRWGSRTSTSAPSYANWLTTTSGVRKTSNCMNDIYDLFANVPDAESLYVKLVEELDKCILGYFAFHWDLSTTFISQALTVDSATKKKLRNLVLEATRKQRFERVTRDLKVTRVFSTLVEEMKAIGIYTGLNGDGEAHCTDVMAPVAHCDRSPVLLLMGGGMGAGKSTVLKEILEEPFWSEAGASALLVEADAFKETDVIYRAISSMGHHNDMLQTAELLQVHQSSLKAASSLLVTALNEGHNVILDGTLSWEPYVEQTVAMARAVHRQRYRMGVRYKVDDDGAITEDYWEPVPDDEETAQNGAEAARKPYRIEVVGVVCDAYLAVARGIRRAIITGRAVGVKSQLMSHKRFAAAFQKYCHLVDGAKLYSTNSLGSAHLIAWKDSGLLVEPNEIDCLEKVGSLNENATSMHDLYPGGGATCGSRSIWDDMVVAPSRATIQRELREAIRFMEPMAIPTAS